MRQYHVRVVTLNPWRWALRGGHPGDKKQGPRQCDSVANYGSPNPKDGTYQTSRVSRLRVRIMTWELSTIGDNFFRERNALLAGVEGLVLGDDFDDD